MKTIILNFEECRYLGAIHKVLKEGFDFPDYYGENLDALWDCLRYYCKSELLVIIKGLSQLPDEFDEYIKKMIEIFADVQEETPNIMFRIES